MVKLKRVLILLLVLILLSSSIVYGQMEGKLENHWSKGIINKSFIMEYFPYLSRNNFQSFNPSASISGEDFKLSIIALLRAYEYDINTIGHGERLIRKDIINMLGQIMDLFEIDLNKEYKLPFKDIDSLSSAERKLLAVLYELDIIQGEPGSKFSPARELSQAEAVIILQRVKEVLDRLNNVAFEVLGVVQSFDRREEIVVANDGDRVLVSITKQFPTPGYSMKVDRIRKVKNGYLIKLDIQEPDPDMNLIQVLTYKTVTIGIPKEELGGGPYNFILEGFNIVAGRVSI